MDAVVIALQWQSGRRAELVTSPILVASEGIQSNRAVRYWRALRSRSRSLVGCLTGLAAVAVVTFSAFRLQLNLSASGSLCLLIVVLVSIVWGFWEASVASLLAVNCLN